MRLFPLLALLLLIPLAAGATSIEAPSPGGFDAYINAQLGPAADFLFGYIFHPFQIPVGDTVAKLPFIVAWLVVGGVFFTFYLNFISVRGFRHAVHLASGKYADKNCKGEVTHFQALATALSGTVGLGNIAGVAVAISIGGPGAAFWMVLAGFLGMSLKFAECTLAVKYRNEYADGTISGGPMYTMRKGLAELGLGPLGRAMALVFCVCCIGAALGGGNMFQVNQAYKQVVNVAGDSAFGLWLAQNAWAFGLFMAVITGMVIIGGIKKIACVTDKLVPFMCGLYLVAGLVVLGVNFAALPEALAKIVTLAFAPDAGVVVGGIIGAMVAGFRRAAFSNEAGFGSAAIAHSAVRTKEPVTEGMVALLEPFIDTIIICTTTALLIVVTGAYTGSSDGVVMTSNAFATVLPWFPVVLTVVVFLFAYSTMISWSYYGLKAWTYLFGEGRWRELAYKLLFCLFIVAGATLSLDKVIDFSDAMMFAMALPNILCLYLLAPTLKREVKHYWDRYQKGEFKRSC